MSMVQIVAGIDTQYFPTALRLLDQLRFESAEVKLVHVLESVLSDRGFPELEPDHPISQILATRKELGQTMLSEASEMLQGTNYRCKEDLIKGIPAQVLIEAADEEKADIIAVGSAQKGKWESLFFGSVTKALTAESRQSILVAKSEPKDKEGLSVVFATDHSPYCNGCLEKFLYWKPRGVRRITLLTAYPYDETPAISDAEETGLAAIREEGRAEIRRKNAEICQRLRDEGYECESRVVDSYPQRGIDAVMTETSADLLILGARGHGFWQRLALGSVSHHAVVASPHNVLVIRA
ncbi:MAG: universal stress protein [Armatimonadetes bacterium]|nr:universal stress protein [Armatimonadota bacterium]